MVKLHVWQYSPLKVEPRERHRERLEASLQQQRVPGDPLLLGKPPEVSADPSGQLQPTFHQ